MATKPMSVGITEYALAGVEYHTFPTYTPMSVAWYAHGAELPDVTKPEVKNFIPAVGTEISRSTQIQFDVTDESSAICAFFLVAYQGGVTELVHDGHGFMPDYAAYSVKSDILNGYRFQVRRRGGWLASPIFKIYAIDHAGNEADVAS